MFHHVTIRASDPAAPERFYDTVLAVLGSDRPAEFSLAGPFWRAGVDAGHADDGAPGPRRQCGPDHYGGFLLDPDGDSAEAVHHDRARHGTIDHLWIRVADVDAAKRFFEGIAEDAGLRLGDDTPDRVQFRVGERSFSLVSGTPTENLHMAFVAGVQRSRVDPDGNTGELVDA